MRPALSVEIERGARLFFPEAIPLLLPWSEGPRYLANRAYSFARQAPLLRAQKHPSTEPAFSAGLEGVKFPYIRKFISVYAKIFFRICGNLFPCGRKFFAVRKEKNFRAHARKILCAQKFIFMRTEIFFCAHRNFAPCPRKRISFRKGANFLGQGRIPLGAEDGKGRRRACTLAGHRAGLVRRYSLGASPMSFMYLRTS